MIARRLAEALLFLETSSRTAADREYVEAIKRIIEEHARMREALEAIACLPDSLRAANIAADVLEQNIGAESVEHDLELHETLLKLSDMLLEDRQLQKTRADRSLLGSLLRKLHVHQPAVDPKARHFS